MILLPKNTIDLVFSTGAAAGAVTVSLVVSIRLSLLPPHEKNKIRALSRKFYAHYGLRTANQIWSGLKNKAGVRAQIREAWELHKDVALAFKILKLYTKMTLNI